MATERRTELQLLENYRVAFQNIKEVELLRTELAEYGYDDGKIAQGKALYDKAQQLFDKNKQETEEEKLAYKHFAKAYDEVAKVYAKHRKIAKVALMNKRELWSSFRIEGAEAEAYLQWIDDARAFYHQAKTNETAQPLLTQFKLQQTDVDAQISKIAEVQTLRAAYEKERGESQDATQNKNKALAEIALWMREFFAVAKIALDDHPQLLESLKKVVKS